MMARKKKEDGTKTKVTTVIAWDAVLDGNLTTDAPIRVDGTVKGDVASKETALVGMSAMITGSIRGADVLIAGTVKGDAIATGKVELTETGKVYGNITTKHLVIDENAYFQGNCTMYHPEVEKEDKKEEKETTAEAAVKESEKKYSSAK